MVYEVHCRAISRYTKCFFFPTESLETLASTRLCRHCRCSTSNLSPIVVHRITPHHTHSTTHSFRIRVHGFSSPGKKCPALSNASRYVDISFLLSPVAWQCSLCHDGANTNGFSGEGPLTSHTLPLIPSPKIYRIVHQTLSLLLTAWFLSIDVVSLCYMHRDVLDSFRTSPTRRLSIFDRGRNFVQSKITLREIGRELTGEVSNSTCAWFFDVLYSSRANVTIAYDHFSKNKDRSEELLPTRRAVVFFQSSHLFAAIAAWFVGV